MKYTLFALAFVVALAGSAFAAPSPTLACSPAPGWPPSAAENLARKDAAFVGTVQSISQDEGDNGEYHITFRVDAAIKGSVAGTVTVRSRSSSAACGYDNAAALFKQGSVWVIYATGNAADGYTTDSLSLNTQYGSINEARSALSLSAPVSSAPSRDLTVGSRGTDVTWLQQYLVARGSGTAAASLSSAGATGYFGSLTRAALAEYQRANGITPAQGYYGAKTRASMTVAVPPLQETRATTFTGTIEAVDTGCFADGTCSVTVGGKKVVVMSGLRVPPIPPLGSLQGVDSIGDLEGKIGTMARVLAAKTQSGSEEYTLYGNESYYLKLVGDVPDNGSVTLRGTMTCLPHMDPTGINTMECALGLDADDGNYYALRDTDAMYANVSGAGSGERIEVKGDFTAGTNDRYPTIGTIEVKRIQKI